MIIDFIIEDLLLDSYLQKNFHTPTFCVQSIDIGPSPPSFELILSNVDGNLQILIITYLPFLICAPI